MKDSRNHWIFVLGLFAFCLFALAPTFFPNYVGEGYPFSKIRLGLDLRGGSYLILGVETDEAVKSQLASLSTGIRSRLKDKGLPVLRTRVVGEGSLQVQLLNHDAVAEVKEIMDSDYSQLSFQNEVARQDAVTLSYLLSTEEQSSIKQNAVVQAIETIRNRVDQFGVAEPTIQRSGKDRLMVQLPEVTNIEEVKKTLGSVAKLEFKIVADQTSKGVETVEVPLASGGVISIEDEVLMTGDAISNARAETDPQTNRQQVGLELNAFGAETFKRITTDSRGRNLAIILDGKVQSYPTINEPIRDGRATISGSFSPEEAQHLAIVLRSGALPAPLTFEEERTVGATLGADSIRKGVFASLVGASAILIFMLAYYKKSGFLAILCLVLNVCFLLTLLSLLGATLTLPGLAGLALTVGMAVDANVIIFERIKEELRSGSSTQVAIRAGFDRAYLTILDSNLTTLITGIVLIMYGTGPIKGFAVTLSIGIISSMFTALYVCRLGFDTFKLGRSERGLSI